MRLEAFKRFKTQAQVDKAICRYMLRSIRAETKRDKCQFESADYWRWHDRAVYWDTKASDLMP